MFAAVDRESKLVLGHYDALPLLSPVRSLLAMPYRLLS
jgi:hypothetical protein